MEDNTTVLEWLERARKYGYPWADAAIENCKKIPFVTLPLKKKLSDAILDGFLWKQSPEGERFWDSVHDRLLEKNL